MDDIIVLDFSKKVYDDLHALTNIYVAKKGKTFNDHWELSNITAYEISDDGLFINIDKKDKMNILQGDAAKNALMLMTYSVKREREITNKNLYKYVKLLKSESLDEEYNLMLNKYLQRFFHPFVCVLLAVMGCLLGFSKPREQRLVGFTIAIGCIFLYYITLPFFDLLAEKGVLAPLITAAFPPVAFMAAIFVFYKTKDL
jgi:lipopolysaccharide export LptBFGC system permease protein LptF